IIADRQQMREPPDEGWLGSGLGFTGRGMSRLLGPRRPRMEAAFERGAESPETIELLNDPPLRNWLESFRSDRVDGVFLITGPNAYSVTSRGNSLRQLFGPTIELMYSEMGTVRPGRERGAEHFGFADGISQPGVRGLSERYRSSAAPEQGLPGQDLLWP